MNFQGALTLLKEGKKVRRKRWVAPLFLWNRRVIAPAHIDIYGYGSTGDSIRWRPTDDDLFADDWEPLVQPKGTNLLAALKLLKQGLRVRHASWAPDDSIKLDARGTIAGAYKLLDLDINAMLSEDWTTAEPEERFEPQSGRETKRKAIDLSQFKGTLRYHNGQYEWDRGEGLIFSTTDPQSLFWELLTEGCQ
jgi:hypothetical protein